MPAREGLDRADPRWRLDTDVNRLWRFQFFGLSAVGERLLESVEELGGGINPIAMTREQEMAVLDKCIDLVTQLSDRRPTGYVAPWWEFSTVTNELLLERGIKYDHSLMHHDHQPYYVRVGDSWTKIDYSKHPKEWMVPLQRGQETELIEIPASWYLDDLPPMLFIKKSPNSHGFVNPRDIEQMWRDQFDWVYRE
jgi:peptidoglycan-N-acetylglucosamine deacetylase